MKTKNKWILGTVGVVLIVTALVLVNPQFQKGNFFGVPTRSIPTIRLELLPDLVITNIQKFNTEVSYKEALSFSIKNTGSKCVTEPQHRVWITSISDIGPRYGGGTVGPKFENQALVPISLCPGEMRNFRQTLQQSISNGGIIHEVTIRADSTNLIRELNETNNSTNRIF